MPPKKKKAPEDVIAEQCLAVRLRMLNRVVTNLYEEELRSFGLTASQMNILVVAAKMEVARPSEVCQYLQLSASTLSRNLERMKARGWLAAIPDQDGRAQPFRVTREGRKLLAKTKPAWDRAQRRVKTLLGPEGTQAIYQMADRLLSAEGE